MQRQLPANGSLWLSGGITPHPTLAPGLWFQSHSTDSFSQPGVPLELSSLFKLSLFVFLIFPPCFPEQKIHLVSTGEGPVVYAHPSKISFGHIQVLQDASQTLHLSNQSVIPASFWAEMVSICGAVTQ